MRLWFAYRYKALKQRLYRITMSDHFVNHRWCEEIIIPFGALENNINFIMSKEDLHIISGDGVRAKVITWKEVHICEIGDMVQRLYKMPTWDFVMRWFNCGTKFASAYFVYIKSEKI